MKKSLIYLVLLLFPILISASLFGLDQPPGVAPGQVCYKTGCNFSGDIYMNGSTIHDAAFMNTTTIFGQNVTGPTYFYNYQNCDRLITAGDGLLVCSDMVSWLYTNGSNADDTIILKNISADFIDANSSWDNLYNYPTGCPDGQAVTNISDTLTCQKFVKIYEENITITVSGGTGTAQTSVCCDDSEISQIAVFPTTGSNTYRFNANTTISDEAVDTDRIEHTGNWIISHIGSVVIGPENLTYIITNASIDEDFLIRLRWQ